MTGATPNRKVNAADIGKAGTKLAAAGIRFLTLGLPRYCTGNLTLLASYDLVRNGKTALTGYTDDMQDDVFTLRMQLRFSVSG